MDDHRCPKCNKLLTAITDRTGRTELSCLKCDHVDPMKTPTAKWAESPLAGPTKAA
jgi:phage FluMu protein Com